MTLEFLDKGGDIRGAILFFKFNQEKTNLFELKKGYARGGHSHDYDIIHTLISGTIEHRTKSIYSSDEIIETVSAPAILKIPANTANLIVALEDSIFSEIFQSEYKSIVYSEYRDIVLKKIKNENTSNSENKLVIENTIEDDRGKIFFLKFGYKKINFIELKKGFARGGHFHPFDSEHIILSGKIKYLEKNLQLDEESEKFYQAPSIIKTKAELAHLFVGLDDTVFIETYDGEYTATYYPDYRKQVEEKLDL